MLRGHRVLFCAPPTFAEQARALGLNFHPVGSDIQALAKNNPAVTSKNPFRALPHQLRALKSEVSGQFRDLLEAARSMGGPPDALMAAGIQIAGASIAHKLGARYIYLAHTNQIVPSDYHPPAGWPNRMPIWMNRLAWRVFDLIMRFVFAKLINRHRRELGLPESADTVGQLLGQHAIVASDPIVRPLPADAARIATQVGSITVEGLARFERQPEAELIMPGDTVPPEVDAFFKAGAPPVYIGFGSMPQEDPAATLAIVVAGARKAGLRAVVSKGWTEYAAGEGAVDGDDVLVVGAVPHGVLFPRCAVLVHHGGAGTFATACRSGVPQVIVPHILDQFTHAEHAIDLGISRSWVARTKLTPDTLAAALREATGDVALKARAEKLARDLNAQDGLGAAVALIERAAGRPDGPGA